MKFSSFDFRILILFVQQCFIIFYNWKPVRQRECRKLSRYKQCVTHTPVCTCVYGGGRVGLRNFQKEEQVSPEAMFFPFDSKGVPVCAYQLHRSIIPRNKRQRLQLFWFTNNLLEVMDCFAFNVGSALVIVVMAQSHSAELCYYTKSGQKLFMIKGSW